MIDPDRLRLEKDLVPIDVRTGPDARERYRTAHLAGARIVDPNDYLANIGPDAAIGANAGLSAIRLIFVSRPTASRIVFSSPVIF